MSENGTPDGSTEMSCQILGPWAVVLKSSGGYWDSGRWFEIDLHMLGLWTWVLRSNGRYWR